MKKLLFVLSLVLITQATYSKNENLCHGNGGYALFKNVNSQEECASWCEDGHYYKRKLITFANALYGSDFIWDEKNPDCHCKCWN